MSDCGEGIFLSREHVFWTSCCIFTTCGSLLECNQRVVVDTEDPYHSCRGDPALSTSPSLSPVMEKIDSIRRN